MSGWYKKIASLAQNSMVQQLLFWAISFWVLISMFAYEDSWYPVDYIYTALFHISLLFVVYCNLRVLIPRFLRTKRYIGYILLSILCLLLGTSLNQFTFNYLSDFLFPEYYFISYYTFGNILLFMVAYFGVSSLLKLSKGWFKLREAEQRLIQLEGEKVKTELQALRSQINPHFLFNSLNSIYSLIMDKKSQSGDAVLQLSQVLRYALYESTGAKVALSQELDNLRQYIELERLRAEEADIRLQVNGQAKEQVIAPLLLLPLVENGFKHGIKGDTDNVFLHIKLTINEQQLTCKVSNNLGYVDQSLPETGGIGLKNLQRRLELLYPNKHHFSTETTATEFIVTLQVQFS